MLEPWTCHCGQRNAGPSPCSACLNAAPSSLNGSVVTVEPWRPSLVHKATALLTAVLLVAGLAAAAVVSRDDPGEVAREDAGPVVARTIEVGPDTVPAAGGSELEQVLPELVRFTARARGLPFLRPVKVTLLGDEDFRARLEANADQDEAEDADEIRTYQRVLEALGLLKKGVDVEAALESLGGDAVLGFYDTETDDLVVRGDELTVTVRVTLVHELTHALQDQHFDLSDDAFEERDDESSLGFHVLVEGDASRVEQIYLDSLSSREQKQFEIERMEIGSRIDPDIPRVLYQYVAFAYLVGPGFTTTVYGRGGQERLDAAFRDPPVSSEQLLHPEVYLAGEGMAPVEAPEADGEVIDEGIFGEFDVLILLAAAGVPGQVAAEGWGGGRYVAWEDGDETCVRVALATDSPQDDAELRQALDRLARSRKGVKVTGKGPLTLTSCG